MSNETHRAPPRCKISAFFSSLLDLLMPGMNGLETASAIRRRLPKVQIVLFSNYTDDLGAALASRVGIDLVLPKGSLTDMAKGLKTLTAPKSSPRNAGQR